MFPDVRSKIFLNRQIAIRYIGSLLFLASLVIPGMYLQEGRIAWYANDNGFTTLLGVLLILAHLVQSGEGWQDALTGILLAISILVNFTIFFSLPKRYAWIPITVPWVLFASLCMGMFPNSRSVAGNLTYYLWALGITLIHGSAYVSISKGSGAAIYKGGGK